MVDSSVQSATVKRVELFVLSSQLAAFQLGVERLQALARKLDVPPWDVQLGPLEWRAVGRDRHQKLEGRSVVIVGQAPVLSGWSFLAKIEHNQAGNLVKAVSDDLQTPLSWHTCSPNCEHCKAPRNRTTTYMLKKIETGDIRQVGSTCVSDFLGQGQRDPEHFVGMYEYLERLSRDYDFDPDHEVEGGMDGAAFGVEPVVLMRTVLKLVQEDGGYISAEKAEQQHCLSTADRLRSAFWSHKPVPVVPDAAHHQQAPQVIEWLKGQQANDSLWLRNIAHLAERPCIGVKDAALFASGFVAWNRALQSQLRAERGGGDWIGEPGEKRTVAATLERMGGFETSFGFKSVLTFRDEEGNALVWKTQSPPQGLVIGSNYHLMGAVKTHSEYAGEKQTEFTRIVVAETAVFDFDSIPKFKRTVAIATPDVGDASGHTPLLKAVWGDKIEHARLLLEAGADANQRNQGEVPVLAYANSVSMAKTLTEFGARPHDVQGEWLQGMVPEVKSWMEETVANQVSGQAPAGGAVQPERSQSARVVTSGTFCGAVVDIADGTVIQKINRAGDLVAHQRSAFPDSLTIGQVVEVTYANGVARMPDPSRSVAMER